MRDINSVKLSGVIFWSKLDDRQTFTLLRLGLKLDNGASIFCTISNPDTKVYDSVKPGNKILLGGAWLDYWEERGETQVKSYGSTVQFFNKESGVNGLNQFTILGKVITYEGDTVLVEMIGDKNPKTGQWSRRKAKVKIGDKYKDIIGKKILIQGELTSVDVDRKSKLVVEADYAKINIL